MNPGVGGVAAVVLTYRRVRLATQVVSGLLKHEGFDPSHVLLVVNGEGGLDDPELQAQINVLHLADNLGPAGGYAAGMRWVAEKLDVRWVYLCEDDVGLFDLPSPRVADLVVRTEQFMQAPSTSARVGAVVAFGRDLDPRTGATRPHAPGTSDELEEVSVAAWGASLLSMEVVTAGILPDPSMFFGYEDFDFWLRMRRAGFRLLQDPCAARTMGDRTSLAGRAQAHAAHRPLDVHEPWRRYYEARNFFVLYRRYGHAGWLLSHLAKSVRRAHLSPTWAHRSALARGLVDGVRGVSGRRAGFERGPGEWHAGSSAI